MPAPKNNLPEFLLRYRRLVATAANLFVAAGAFTLAFLLRFDFSIPSAYRVAFHRSLVASIIIHYTAFHVFKLTRGWWRYAGIGDFLNALKAAFCGGVSLAAFVVIFMPQSFFPRSLLFLNAVLIVGFSVGLRLAVRLWRQMPIERDLGPLRRLCIIGAGDTGEALLREVRQSHRLPYKVVAFVDDNVKKRGAYIDGVPVVDGVSALAEVVKRFSIDELTVATPSASGAEMRLIIDACRAAGKPFKVLPATWEVLHGRVSIGAAREVEIHDLLRRPPVELDTAAIGTFLHGKCVLVTGAAGSIGSEICRQVLRQEPRRLVCVDHDENAVFYLERDLSRSEHCGALVFRLGDITDERSMTSLFSTFRPQVVFHAAAHKHVPMLETNPIEGLRNNVLGTELVARIAARVGAEAFVLISTDKAVNPSSVMGVSKRIAELLIRTMPSETRYTAVRFGNVLGSQGSVVPLLKEQIAAGGPVTITHPDMARYFMTIPEAVELVIQASTMGTGDEIFMLEMGEPVKIVDLATDLIKLSGLRPHVDIEIKYTGVRAGEKLSEELHLNAEIADHTSHPKIMVARHVPFDAERFQLKLAELRRAVSDGNEAAALRLIPDLVPEYRRQVTRVSPIEPPVKAIPATISIVAAE